MKPDEILDIEIASLEEVGQLADLFRANRHLVRRLPGDDFWNLRTLPCDVLPEEGQRRMIALGERVAMVAGAYFRASLVFCDFLHMVVWPPGSSMPAHHDKVGPDLMHRDFAAVVWLTDKFSGGRLFIPEAGLSYKPRAGRCIAYRGNVDHGVTKVQGGEEERITLPMFFTDKPERAWKSTLPMQDSH